MLSILLVFVILAIGVVAYRLGKRDGFAEGYIVGVDDTLIKLHPGSRTVRVIPPQG